MKGVIKVVVKYGTCPPPSTFVGHANVALVDDAVFIDACEQMPETAVAATGITMDVYPMHRFIMTKALAARLYKAIGEVLICDVDPEEPDRTPPE